MRDTDNQFPSDTDNQFPSRDDDWEGLIRKINESPHDGSKVEKIDLSGVNYPNFDGTIVIDDEGLHLTSYNESLGKDVTITLGSEEDFEEGVEDLFENYDNTLRELGDR